MVAARFSETRKQTYDFVRHCNPENYHLKVRQVTAVPAGTGKCKCTPIEAPSSLPDLFRRYCLLFSDTTCWHFVTHVSWVRTVFPPWSVDCADALRRMPPQYMVPCFQTEFLLYLFLIICDNLGTLTCRTIVASLKCDSVTVKWEHVHGIRAQDAEKNIWI
jgi:hypothetical protein